MVALLRTPADAAEIVTNRGPGPGAGDRIPSSSVYRSPALVTGPDVVVQMRLLSRIVM